MSRRVLRVMPSLARSRGIGIITAIFLLVVIAGLAVAMVTVFTTQQISSALDLQGARAYQAARAGVEWGVFKHAAPGACDGATSFAMDANSALGGFTVTVSCQLVVGPDTGPDNPGALDQRKVRAVACNAPNAAGACPNPSNSDAYVQRVMEVTF